MMPAAKHLDPILGIDIHIIQPPGPVPPLPIPHPHLGMVFDPFDYIPFLGATVVIGGLPRAQAGTACQPMPPAHIPIGGVFVMPPGNESEMFMGSATVDIDGDAASHLVHPVLSCQSVGMLSPFRPKKPKKTFSFVLPTTMALSIPMPVFVGGPPTISLMALGMRAAMGAATRALGGLAGAARRMRNSRRMRRGANGRRCNGLHPVNIVTGEQFDTFLDAKAAPESLFRWERYYTTARRHDDRGVGFGFSHCWDHRIDLSPQGWRYVDWKGAETVFDPLDAPGDTATVHGRRLTRRADDRLELHHGADPVLVFTASPGAPTARLTSVHTDSSRLELYHRDGRLHTLTERPSDGPVVRYAVEYDAAGRIKAVVRQTNGLKQLAVYAYDPAGCLVASWDAHRGKHVYAYDARRLMTGMTDPRGYRFWWTYDAKGRCVEGAGEDGLWWGRLDYRPDDNETHVTERDGGVYVYRYDENQTLREMEDPYGGVLRREVGDDGRVLREIDSGGRTLRWLYDADGVHYARLDDLGFLYPPETEMSRLPDPMAPSAPTTALAWAVGEASERLDAVDVARGDGHAAGDRSAAADAARVDVSVASSQRAPRAPERQYDAMGRLVASVDAAGRRREWRYDATGNPVWHRDADGRVYEARTTRWNLIGEEIDPLGHSVRYAYTSTERVREIVDAGGTVSRYDYDEKDRLVQVHRHGALRDTYVYDAGDRMVEKRDASGDGLVEMTYDERSLLTGRTLASGDTHTLAYDAAGRPTEASTGAHTVRIERDVRGRVRADTVDDVGLVRTRDGRVNVLRLFDAFDVRVETGPDRVRVTDPTGLVHTLHLLDDRRVLRVHGDDVFESSRYDDEGRLLHRRYRGPSGRQAETTYRYTPEGDLVAVDDTERGPTRYRVDAAHRLVEEDGPDGVFRYVHDAAGNLVQAPSLRGVELDGNRLVRANGIRYVYDHRQHLAEAHHPDGRVVRYTYDSLDFLIRVDDAHPNGPWTATYDALGRRLSCGRADAQTRFYWDDDRLAARSAPDGSVRLYLYPDVDARVPWGVVDYDAVDAAPETGRAYLVFANPVGCPIRLEDTAGRVVWRARRVDAYGAVDVDPASTIDVAIRWPGHYFDADTGLHDNRYRSYHPRLGRYLQTDPIGTAGGINTYAYAPNPVCQVDVLGLSHDDVTPPASARRGSSSPNGESVPRAGGDPNAPARNGQSLGSDNLTDAQRVHYRQRIDNASSPEAAAQARYDRNCTARANRGHDPLEPGDWSVREQRMRENQARGRAHEDAALNDAGVPNNNNNSPPETFRDDSRGVVTRPDAVTDTAVVDVKSVPDDADSVVYNTEQLRLQQQGARETGRGHVTVITNGNRGRTRPSGPLGSGQAGQGSDVVLHRNSQTGDWSSWNPNANNGQGDWVGIEDPDLVRGLLGGSS